MASQRNPPAGLEGFLRALLPKRDAALRQYRWRAPLYDPELIFATRVRRLAVARLALKSAQTVLDVGCGTGLSLALLEQRIGPHGRIVGIEQSPQMLAQARARVQENGWKNVTLLLSPVEEAGLALKADGALFCFTHDIMRTPEALDNVFRHLKRGARVVATGLKWAPRIYLPINLMVLYAALASTTGLEGLEAPWSHLARFVPNLEVEELLAGTLYLASGIAGPSSRKRK
jgi:SAM-dependent methyltransferase